MCKCGLSSNARNTRASLDLTVLQNYTCQSHLPHNSSIEHYMQASLQFLPVSLVTRQASSAYLNALCETNGGRSSCEDRNKLDLGDCLMSKDKDDKAV